MAHRETETERDRDGKERERDREKETVRQTIKQTRQTGRERKIQKLRVGGGQRERDRQCK